MTPPLTGRTALVTGVSRKRGIGFAVASRLASMGASLAVHHHLDYDASEYGAVEDQESLHADLRALLVEGARVVDLAGDLGDAATAEGLVPAANEALGHLNILVCNHAHGDTP